MKIQPFVYLEPKSLREALAMLDEHKEKLKVLSGGTEIVSLLKLHLIKPQYVMSLKRISSLKGIQEQESRIVIGASTTLRQLMESATIQSFFTGIIEAARAVAAPHIQNVGTIAGNILQDTRCLFYNQSQLVKSGLEPCLKMKGHLCHAVRGAKRCFSVYQSDLAPILVAFQAKARLESKCGTRTVPVFDLFSGNGKQPIILRKNELLTSIILPKPKGLVGSSYQKLRLRGSVDYPLAAVASIVYADERGRIVNSRVVLGAAGPSPKIVPTDSLTIGYETNIEWANEVSQAAYEVAEGVNNQPLPGLYRRKMMKVLARRALDNSLKDIHGGQ